MRGYFENTGRLVRFFLRRERVMSVIWLVSLVGISILVPPAMDNMFTSPEETYGMIETLKNPMMVAMAGPVYYDIGNYTTGAITANEMLLFTMLAVAIMNIFLVTRHTRSDEERGRAEVIRSLPVGRLSTLSATIIVAVIVNSLLSLLTGLGLAALGIDGLGFNASMLYGATLGAIGMFFAAVAAIFVQLCSSSRGANGYSMVVLACLFMMRAVGDAGNEALSLASPLGLILRSQVAVNNYWWPVFVVLLLSVVAAVIALKLNAVRDMDQGFIPARPGRRHASIMLASPLGLAFRLLRNSMFAWAAGIFLIGAAYGSIMGTLETFIEENDFFRNMIMVSEDFSAAEMFIMTILMITALIAAIPAIMAILKLRGEERDGQSEHILARVVSRHRYLAGFFAIAFAASIIMPLMGAAGLWAAAASVMEDPVAFGSICKTIMVYLPAFWVMMGLAVLLTGLFPRSASAVSWGYLGFSLFVLYIGRILNLPEWAVKLTPFGYIPQLPMDTVNYATLAVLTGVSIILTVAGFLFYRNRDMKA